MDMNLDKYFIKSIEGRANDITRFILHSGKNLHYGIQSNHSSYHGEVILVDKNNK